MTKLLLAILLSAPLGFSQIGVENLCTTTLPGPVESIQCSLSNVEPDRAFLITLHYNGLGHVQEIRPVELGFVGEPLSTTSQGNDTWFLSTLDTWGDQCFSGPLQFGFAFDAPAYNIQLGVFQINGVGVEDGTFPSPRYGDWSPPFASLPGVQAGDLVVGWVNTGNSLNPFGYGPGGGYRFLAGTDRDAWEYQIANTTTDTQSVSWAGRPSYPVQWVMLAGAFHPQERKSYCLSTRLLPFSFYRPRVQPRRFF